MVVYGPVLQSLLGGGGGRAAPLPSCPTLSLVLLMQPSSAAAERVFSLLENSLSEKQARTLEDYIETSIMLQYNSKSIS